MVPQTVIFFGPSGAGKGTQADTLQAYIEEHYPEIPVLSFDGGEQIRSFIKEHPGAVAERAADLINEGNLLPSFIPIWLLSSFLIKNYSGKEFLMLDGVRLLPEFKMLEEALEFFGAPQMHAIILDVPEDVCRERLRIRGREDDLDDEYVSKRLAWYEAEVLPSIEYLREKDGYHVHDINGNQPIEGVQEDIRTALNIDTTS